MTKTELSKLSKDELVDLAVKQNEQIDSLRGYESGLTREILEVFDSKTLIDCYLKSQEILKKFK